MTKSYRANVAQLARSFRTATSETDEAIYSFFASLNCPRSLALWLLYSNQEFEQLVCVETDPSYYNSATEFRDAYTATEFLSKADFLPLAVSKSDAAFRKFSEYESLCKSTNDRFRNLSLDPQFHGSNAALLSAMQRKIDWILGDFKSEEFVDKAYWGPGVTTVLHGSNVSAEQKFQSETGITRDLYDFIAPWFAIAYPGWAIHLRSGGGWTPELGNKVVTVPKNSKTDRVIAVEPGFNLWFQKGIGAMLRSRLRRVGIDLNTQENNSALAYEGSLSGELATVDFSSASDSISRYLVQEVIPHTWYSIMDSSRSKLGVQEGSLIKWNKFSSMGNGFTFELESLIFYAAAAAVCEYSGCSSEKVSVFGDDVIIPSECLVLFRQFCTFLGFRVNERKSFGSGYFRESCGSHFFDGLNCKPIYLKRRLSNVQTIFKLANSVRDLAHRRSSYDGCDSRFRHCWSRLFHRVPKSLRLRISRGYGEAGFIVNFDEAVPTVARHGIEGFYVPGLIESGLTRQFDGEGVLLARLSRRSVDQAHGNNLSLRGRTRLLVKNILVHQWYNLGAWR